MAGLTAMLAAFPMQATADVLLMDSISQQPVNSAAGLPRPTAQMTMDEVRSGFGEPEQRIAAVGEPPISRWIYKDFTVYFENDRVLTSVVHR